MCVPILKSSHPYWQVGYKYCIPWTSGFTELFIHLQTPKAQIAIAVLEIKYVEKIEQGLLSLSPPIPSNASASEQGARSVSGISTRVDQNLAAWYV